MGKLRLNKEGTLVAQIYDDEGDPIKCSFHDDGCVELDTDGYSYISLTREDLFYLASLISKSHERYEKIAKKESLKEIPFNESVNLKL